MITTTTTESSNLKAELNFGYIWLISVVAALGGLLFGWDWVVVGGAKPFFERYFHIADNAQSQPNSRPPSAATTEISQM